MTLEQKVYMLHGNGFFTSDGVKKIGIPGMHYDDGPFGVRPEVHTNSWKPLGLTTDSATYLPTGSALAAACNRKLAFEYGKVLGQEARAGGKDIILGPATHKNIPVYIGEFSCARAAGSDGDAYLKDLINLFESAGWSWTYHAFRDSPDWDPEMSYTNPPTNDPVTRSPDAPRVTMLRKYYKRNKKH